MHSHSHEPLNTLPSFRLALFVPLGCLKRFVRFDRYYSTCGYYTALPIYIAGDSVMRKDHPGLRQGITFPIPRFSDVRIVHGAAQSSSCSSFSASFHTDSQSWRRGIAVRCGRSIIGTHPCQHLILESSTEHRVLHLDLNAAEDHWYALLTGKRWTRLCHLY